MTHIENINIQNLRFDHRNPRISEFGVTQNTSQQEILQILWDEMAVNELVYSIVTNGYWNYEPLIVLKNEMNYIVVEGNRRLAAVMIIHNEAVIEGSIPKNIKNRITTTLLENTLVLPALIISERKEAWQFVGFKHVNGPAKWGSFAKAKYIAEVHNDFGIALSEIAFQIGDTHKTTQKLYQALMVLEQAERANVFNYEDINAPRLYFSHLYSGIQREGIRRFINIQKIEEEAIRPVPTDKIKELGLLLEWLFGSKKNKTLSVIISQNPDLMYLDEILKDKEAMLALRSGESLHHAYEISRSAGDVFDEHLIAAKRNLQKARAFTTAGYKGDEDLQRTAGTVANLADDLYNEMYEKYQSITLRPKKVRLSE